MAIADENSGELCLTPGSCAEEARPCNFLADARRQPLLIADSEEEAEVMRWIQEVSSESSPFANGHSLSFLARTR